MKGILKLDSTIGAYREALQPDAEFSIPVAAFETAPPAIPVGVPSELLERRPDIAAAERAVAQANAQIGAAKAAYFPSVILSATGGFQSTSIVNWLTWPGRVWSLGPSLAETIFEGGARRATVQQYQAAYDATAANYRQTVLTSFQQVEDNLAALRILGQVVEEQEGAIASARRNLQEAGVRYAAGLDPYLERDRRTNRAPHQRAGADRFPRTADGGERSIDQGAGGRLGGIADTVGEGSGSERRRNRPGE